jgi:hypothetical protein
MEGSLDVSRQLFFGPDNPKSKIANPKSEA